jgi:hypothetical protein
MLFQHFNQSSRESKLARVEFENKQKVVHAYSTSKYKTIRGSPIEYVVQNSNSKLAKNNNFILGDDDEDDQLVNVE